MAPFFERLEAADKCATLAINSLHCPALDAIWMFFSDKLVWAPLYLLVIFFLFRKLGWRKAIAVTISAVLTVLLCDQLGNLCKNGTMRLRPCYDAFMVSGGLRLLEGEGNLFGFYSAHAANAFGVACCTSVVFRKHCKGGLETERKRKRLIDVYTVVMIGWAFLVSISRIFVGKHFLGDVVVGAVVGVVFGLIFGCVTNLIIEKFVIHDADRVSTTENGVQI